MLNGKAQIAGVLVALALTLLLLTSTSYHQSARHTRVWEGSTDQKWRHGLPSEPWPDGSGARLAAAGRADTLVYAQAPAQPSYPSFELVRAATVSSAGHSPGVDPQLVREFAAAPWLLPRRTPALRYAGVHDFDALLRLRSAPAGPYQKSIALFLFDRARAVFAQNAVYSMVKMGGVQNYMMLTWTASDLAACADLNLPCADVSPWLLKPTAEGQEAQFGSPDFNAVNWLKPPAMLQAAQQGHAVLMLDTDIAFTVKPVWASLLAFTEQAAADGAWQEESGTVGNTGFVFLRPTPGGLAYLQGWNASAPAMLAAGLSEQKCQPKLLGKQLVACSSLCQCHRADFDMSRHHVRHTKGLIRSFLAGVHAYGAGHCMLGADPLWVPRIDPCPAAVLFLHPICTTGPDATAQKRQGLKAAGFWFMDDEHGCPTQPGSASEVPSCRPLEWRVPGTEAPHYSCPTYSLALVHGGEPTAVAALREGRLGHEELERSFQNRRC